MKHFARLLDQLSYTPSRTGKLALLANYFQSIGDPDRGYALAALTNDIKIPIAARQVIQRLATRHVTAELFQISRDYVGDSAETLALIWPDKPHLEGPSLSEVFRQTSAVSRSSADDLIANWLDQLDSTGRWALLKFIGGALRTGVSARLAKLAVAQAFRKDVEDIEQSWHGLEIPYFELFSWLEGRAERPIVRDAPVFRPLMLANALEDIELESLDPDAFQVEWKWDGIRVQISSRSNAFKIYSRSGDDISASFPEIADLSFSATLDGELLVGRNGVVAPFQDLQQRLNRKTVTKKLMDQYPAFVRLYDILDVGGEDLRMLALSERRRRLVDWYHKISPNWADLSEIINPTSLVELKGIWAASRDEGIEGMMLKRRDSAYVSGRPKGLWWKWKRSPLTADCVLLYAQRGSGKRSSYYSDYTFGAWDETKSPPELVPVGKAYSGFTDEELKRLDYFVRHNTTQTFGPVRQLNPELVFEVAFDAVQKSTRHKSGIAMRFPRISRVRWDKPAKEADTLQTIIALI
jgi:DNA ligase 1